MPFADETANHVYESIVKPLCSDLGYDVVRADEYATTKVIYDEIVQSIQDAAIVIVDISGMNPNVMYELGIAHAFRQPSTIILTYDKADSIPFDIKHFRINVYENSIRGGKKLETKLRDTIKTIQKSGHATPIKPEHPTQPTKGDDNNIGPEREKVRKIFSRLSDWQKDFLIRAVHNDKRQWQRYEMPSGFEALWGPEVEVLLHKGIVSQVSYGVFLINDDFFDILQEAYFTELEAKNAKEGV